MFNKVQDRIHKMISKLILLAYLLLGRNKPKKVFSTQKHLNLRAERK